VSSEECIHLGCIAVISPFSSQQQKGITMPCYQAAPFPKRPVFSPSPLISTLIHREQLLTQPLSKSQPHSSRHQPLRAESSQTKDGKSEKKKNFGKPELWWGFFFLLLR